MLSKWDGRFIGRPFFIRFRSNAPKIKSYVFELSNFIPLGPVAIVFHCTY